VIAAAALVASMLARQAAAVASTKIELTDEALTMPAQIPAGMVAFAVTNTGSVAHDLRFVRISAGHTFDQFKVWKESGKAIPDWLVSSGGVGAIGPSMTVDYAASLPSGSYAVLADNRMAQALTVTTAKAAAVNLPEADVTIRLHDHGFQLTAPVPPGRPLFRVQNAGSEPHQMLIIRLPEGANEFRQRAWISAGSRGESPGEQYGGILELAPDGEAWFRAPLKPGRYILICGEQEQEGRHFDLGMVYRFEVE